MLETVWRPALWLTIGCAAGVLGVLSAAPRFTGTVSEQAEQAATAVPKNTWAAAGPGRVEPRFGEIRIIATAPGRISKIYVHPRDMVQAGALLGEIGNSEELAKVKATEAEVLFRKSERDNALSSVGSNERGAEEDAVAAAELAVDARRLERDRIDVAVRAGEMKADALDAANAALALAETHLADDRKALLMIIAVAGEVPPTRTESALAVARAELAGANAALEKTKIRSPYAGHVIQLYKTAGEMAAASAEDPLMTFGDLTQLRVRAEVGERDIGQVSVGQEAIVRADAFQGQDFPAKVVMTGAGTRPKRLLARVPGDASNDGVLEVIAELTSASPLLPGMRVDVFFKTAKPETAKEALNELR